jgi:lysophospholipase L1-like esterase
VALLGDSLSAGVAYRTELEALLGPCSAVQAFAHPNQGTGVIKSHLWEALAWEPTDLVVLAGVNDLASGRSVDTVISNLQQIYGLASAEGVRVIALTLTPWGNHPKGSMLQYETDLVNDWIRFNSPADVVVDTSPLSDGTDAAHPALVGADGLHLNTTGQKALAQEVYLQGFMT